MRWALLFLALASCGRSLSVSETRLAQELMGESFAPSEVRLLEVGVIGMSTRRYPTRPAVTCRQRLSPPPDGPTFQTRTAGVVLFERVMTSPDWTLPDYMPGYPEQMNLIAAMYFAHEMTHVWQWQNRDITGYHPFRAAAEHRPGADPYLLDPSDDTPFLSLGYEQQAVMVEEFVCCRTLAPQAARTERLWRTLSAAMPVTHPSQTPLTRAVAGIYPDADLSGICD